MNFVPYFSFHAICSLSTDQKGNCIISSLQSVEFDLRSWGGIELDQGQSPESGPGQVRSPNHSANLATRVDGGVPVQADQLGQPRLNQHLPFDNRGKLWKSWRQDPCNFHPTKPRLLFCQQRSHKLLHSPSRANGRQVDQAPIVRGAAEREDQAQVLQRRRRDAQRW